MRLNTALTWPLRRYVAEGIAVMIDQSSSAYTTPSSMSPLERRNFDQWLMTNMVVGSAWVVALAAIVLVGSMYPDKDRASASAYSTTVTAAAR